MVRGYSLSQVLLHWIVALLVLAQYLNDDAIGGAWQAFRKGQEVPTAALATAHIVVGATILALVAWRIALRLTRGAPPAPEEEPRVLRVVAAATHGLLYLLLLGLTLTGMAGWFGGIAAAVDVHGALQNVLLLLIALHVGGALYQRFILGSDVLARMTRPLRGQER